MFASKQNITAYHNKKDCHSEKREYKMGCTKLKVFFIGRRVGRESHQQKKKRFFLGQDRWKGANKDIKCRLPLLSLSGVGKQRRYL